MNTTVFVVGAIFTALLGTVVGSFLNVCIYRLLRCESLVHPPSHCPNCNHRLGFLDLFPIFSYLFLGGKCRYCKVKITPRYAIIEAITGILFLATWWALALRFGDDLLFGLGPLILLAGWVFIAAMLVTFQIDLETTYVIESVTWVAMGAGLTAELAEKFLRAEQISFSIAGITIPYLPAAIPGMILGFLVFVLMDLFGRLVFRKPGMGLGDAYIGAAIGAMLGPWAALLSFGMAIALGALIGVFLIILGRLKKTPAPGAVEERAEKNAVKRKKQQPAPESEEEELPEGTYMPFGPFLTACAVIIYLAPTWWLEQAGRLMNWWLFENPFMG
ncbi:MAG: prepilin peptidase [bacterium]